MSHTIKLEDQVFEKLQSLQGHRETYSQTVERLIRVVQTLDQVVEILGPSHHIMSRSPHQEATEHSTERGTK